jgi:hypothetical protein
MRPLILYLRVFAALALAGCGKKAAPEKTVPEGYRVVSYDGAKKEWTLIRTGTFDGGEHRTIRLVLVCDSYERSGRPPSEGPDSCALEVGRLMVPSHAAEKPFLDIYQIQDTLAIIEGRGANQVSQHLFIVKHELISPK